jgi:hypothetical protein
VRPATTLVLVLLVVALLGAAVLQFVFLAG